MKLNPDCIRNVLLTLEDNTDGIVPFEYCEGDQRYPLLLAYEHSVILYHMKQCSMAKLIEGYQSFDMGSSVLVSDLSPKGHEFLANIQKDTTWEKVKTTAAKVGSTSLGTLMQIATSIVSDLITKHFNA